MGERPWWGSEATLLRELQPASQPRIAMATSRGEMAVRTRIAGPQAHSAVLGPEESALVRRLAEDRGFAYAHDTYGGEERPQSRRCHSAYLPLDADTSWLYDRMAEMFERANRIYGFAAYGMVEPLMVASYGEGDHFDWHLDIGPELCANRKLSASVLLSPPAHYDGGGLDFAGAVNAPRIPDEGGAVVFPSFLAHRVTRVTRGRRVSLIAFAHGPSFT